jgi:phage terminase large subunit-like protein
LKKVVDIYTGYVARPWQRAVSAILKRFSVLVVHRRGGKTVLAVNTLIDAASRCKKRMGRFAYVAPFLSQARSVAWDYVKAYTSEIPGIRYNNSLMIAEFPNGARIQLFGADNPDALRGMYFDGVVMDEVADMRPNVWGEVIRPALTDRLGWALFIGTPRGINLFSELYYRAVENEDWAAALYTCYDTDALSADEIERAKQEMTEAEFAQEMLCDFHAAVSNCLMSVADVEAAMARKYAATAYEHAAKVMGVDPAWMGGDRSAYCKVQGIQSHGHWSERGVDPMDFASIVSHASHDWKPEAIFVDVGYAPGVCSRLQQLGHPAIGVQFGGKAIETRFENKRAEMWWALAKWVKHASLPRDSSIVTDFCAPTWKSNRHGRIIIESKEEMRARGMPSPDLGDCYALVHADEVIPAAVIADREQFGAQPTDWQDYKPLGGM